MNMERDAVESVVMGYAEWHEREALSLRLHRADSPVMPELAEMHEGTAATLRALLARAEAAEAQVKWWQADSAAGWNKCEERRLQAEQAEAERDAALATMAEWREEPAGGISKAGVTYLSPERVEAAIQAEREAIATWLETHICGYGHVKGTVIERVITPGKDLGNHMLAAAIRARGGSHT